MRAPLRALADPQAQLLALGADVVPARRAEVRCQPGQLRQLGRAALGLLDRTVRALNQCHLAAGSTDSGNGGQAGKNPNPRPFNHRDHRHCRHYSVARTSITATAAAGRGLC